MTFFSFVILGLDLRIRSNDCSRHCEQSEAIQSDNLSLRKHLYNDSNAYTGLLRLFQPRNDDKGERMF